MNELESVDATAPAEEVLSPQGKQGKRRHRTNTEEVMGWIFAGIPLLGFLIFGVIPIVVSFYVSVNHFPTLRLYSYSDDLFNQPVTFVGFGNFKDVLTDPKFWQSVANTLFVVFTTLFSLALSVFISMMLYHAKGGKKFFQTVFFIPYVCSLVAITFMWQQIFDREHGVINSLIMTLGGNPLNWLNYSADRFRFVMFIVMVWSGTGFNIILLSAAMTNINKNIYEAAEIDGAGMFTKFFRLTLPAISPTIFYLLITGLIGSLQEFTRFQIMVGENDTAVGGANITIVYYLYQKMNLNGYLGTATATGWILAVMIGLVTLANFVISKKWVSYDE